MDNVERGRDTAKKFLGGRGKDAVDCSQIVARELNVNEDQRVQEVYEITRHPHFVRSQPNFSHYFATDLLQQIYYLKHISFKVKSKFGSYKFEIYFHPSMAWNMVIFIGLKLSLGLFKFKSNDF